MNGLKITNKTGDVRDTKVTFNGIEIQNSITKVEIVHHAGCLPMANFTMIVGEIDFACKVGTINKLEMNKNGLSRIN